LDEGFFVAMIGLVCKSICFYGVRG